MGNLDLNRIKISRSRILNTYKHILALHDRYEVLGQFPPKITINWLDI